MLYIFCTINIKIYLSYFFLKKTTEQTVPWFLQKAKTKILLT